MKQMLDAIFEKYGTPVTIRHGETSTKVRGFFQADRSKSWQSVVNEGTLLGEIPRRNFVYIGPAMEPLGSGDMLMVGSRSYIMRRVERYYYGDAPAYVWALCVEKGGEDIWVEQS